MAAGAPELLQVPRVHRAQPAVPLRGLGQVKVALLMQKDPFPILVVLLLGPGPLMVVALLWQGYNPGAILPGLP